MLHISITDTDNGDVLVNKDAYALIGATESTQFAICRGTNLALLLSAISAKDKAEQKLVEVGRESANIALATYYGIETGLLDREDLDQMMDCADENSENPD